MRYNILSNGKTINTIVADEDFCKRYCEKKGYTYTAMDDTTDSTPLSSPQSDIDAMLIDHEYRLTLIEIGVE